CFHISCVLLVLHSFPTRRSSDLRTSLSELIFPYTSGIGVISKSLPKDKAYNSSLSYSVVVLRSVIRSSCSPSDTFINSVSPYTTDRKSTRLNSSHVSISYAVFCL